LLWVTAGSYSRFVLAFNSSYRSIRPTALDSFTQRRLAADSAEANVEYR